MSRKHLLILSLLVVVPLAVFFWLGLRLVSNEQERTQRQFEELLRANLSEVDRAVAGHFASQERALLRGELQNTSTDNLRSLLRKEAAFEQILVLDQDGFPIFPDEPRSRRETEYLIKIKQVLTDRDLVRLASAAAPDATNVLDTTRKRKLPAPVTKAALKSSPSNQQALANTASQPNQGYGWYTWYWGKGLQILHWRRLDDGRVLAVGLQRARWIADVISVLPDTTAGSDQDAAPALIRLVDAKGRTVYQWGTKSIPDDLPPIATLNLRAPLRPWQLQHFGPSRPLHTSSSGLLINLIAAGGFLGAGLLGLAIYLSREVGRQMREARQRVSFVNQVSHELKTPLTNIRMYADLLEQDLAQIEPEPTERAQSHLSVITSESSRLGRLINNVLSLARLRRGATQIRRQPACVDKIIRGVVDQFRPSLDQLEIEVSIDLDTADWVVVDTDAVEQMLGNLISNVEKYAKSGKRLRITSFREQEMIVIDVADDGPGIQPEFTRKIFEPFERASDQVEAAAGTGIGLAIAQGLARGHGGDLTLIPSQSGACFRLSIHAPAANQLHTKKTEERS